MKTIDEELSQFLFLLLKCAIFTRKSFFSPDIFVGHWNLKMKGTQQLVLLSNEKAWLSTICAHTHDMVNVSELANTTFEILQDRFDGFEQSIVLCKAQPSHQNCTSFKNGQHRSSVLKF